MPEQNIFKGIDNRDINEYISSSADRKKSKVSQMIDNLREASLNVKTYEEAEKLAKEFGQFAVQLDANNEKHRSFYNSLTYIFIDSLPRKFRKHTFYDACPTVDKIKLILLSPYSSLLDENKLSGEASLTKIPLQLQENLQTASYSAFEKVLPLIYNADCNPSLRDKINDCLIQSSNDLTASMKAEFHSFKTLKKLKGNIFKEKVKEILQKDALFYKVTRYNKKLPETLSDRFDLFLKAGDFQNDDTTQKFINELVFMDIRDGKAEQTGADKIAALLASDIHLGDLIKKISVEKLDQTFKYAYKNHLKIGQTVYYKFLNKELAATNDWDKILNMTRYSKTLPLVKDSQIFLETAAQKIAEIKNSQKYAKITADVKTYEIMATDLKKYYDRRNNFSYSSHQLEEIQKLTENILKNFNSRKDQGLSANDLEQAVGNALNDNFVPLQHTDMKLPFLFGKKEEKRRQELLNSAVDQLNKTLKEFSGSKENSEIKSILSEYSGKLLEKETLDAVKQDFQKAQQEAIRKADELTCYEKDMNIREKKQFLENVAMSEESVRKSNVSAGKEKDRRLSSARSKLKENTGIDTTKGQSGVIKADKLAAEVIRTQKGNSI